MFAVTDPLLIKGASKTGILPNWRINFTWRRTAMEWLKFNFFKLIVLSHLNLLEWPKNLTTTIFSAPVLLNYSGKNKGNGKIRNGALLILHWFHF